MGGEGFLRSFSQGVSLGERLRGVSDRALRIHPQGSAAGGPAAARQFARAGASPDSGGGLGSSTSAAFSFTDCNSTVCPCRIVWAYRRVRQSRNITYKEENKFKKSRASHEPLLAETLSFDHVDGSGTVGGGGRGAGEEVARTAGLRLLGHQADADRLRLLPRRRPSPSRGEAAPSRSRRARSSRPRCPPGRRCKPSRERSASRTEQPCSRTYSLIRLFVASFTRGGRGACSPSAARPRCVAGQGPRCHVSSAASLRAVVYPSL